MMTDVRFASRQLLKSPGFTLLALMTLALGIGLNSAIFSLIDDLFLRGLPYSAPERVGHMYANAKDRDLNEIALSGPRFMYTVGQRTGEIGVRMAFGAETRDVQRLVVDQGMRPVAFGLAAGLAAALALGRLIASQLYQTSAYSPALLALTMGILAAAALLACGLPARRASRVNPVDALRAS